MKIKLPIINVTPLVSKIGIYDFSFIKEKIRIDPRFSVGEYLLLFDTLFCKIKILSLGVFERERGILVYNQDTESYYLISDLLWDYKPYYCELGVEEQDIDKYENAEHSIIKSLIKDNYSEELGDIIFL